MNPTLKKRIDDIRQRLEGRDETTGFVALPSIRRSFPNHVPVSYQDVLREMDGMVGGVVMLYESDGLLDHQAPTKALPGGGARWFCFGAVEDYPLVLDRRTDAVHLAPLEGRLDEEESLGDLDYFLLTSVFGEEYADFVVNPDEDLWYQLVHSAGD